MSLKNLSRSPNPAGKERHFSSCPDRNHVILQTRTGREERKEDGEIPTEGREKKQINGCTGTHPQQPAASPKARRGCESSQVGTKT